jgi:DNA-binding MarR family transcriptional regulator
MLEPSLHINTPAPIPPGALAMLPEDFAPGEAQPRPEAAPSATSEAVEQLLAEAVAFVNQARKTLPHLPGEDAMHSGERSILRILEETGPSTVPQIARARSTSRQNVQIIINRLTAESRVEFHDNPSHKRSKLVVLTARGRQWLEAFNKTAPLALPAKVRIPAAEIHAAGQVLLRLRRALAEGLEPETQAKRPGAGSAGQAAETASAEKANVPEPGGAG